MNFLDLLASLFGPKPSVPAPSPVVDVVPHAKQAAPASPVVFTPAEMHAATGPVGGFTAAFNRAFVHAMKWETGLLIDLNDPEIQQGLIATPAQRRKVGYTDGVSGASVHDSGGETKFGVAQNAHPDLVVRTLTLAQAEAVYKKGYWDAVKGDEFIHGEVAGYVFDIGCGSGPSKGIHLLQEALGVAVDGVIGEQTMSAANHEDPAQLIAKLQSLRCAYYRSIVANNPSQGIFLQGWLNRANDLS